MISHLNQYIVDKMTHSCKIVCIFILCMVRYIFFGIKLISRLIGLIHENIAKIANKIFNAPNHFNSVCLITSCLLVVDNVNDLSLLANGL